MYPYQITVIVTYPDGYEERTTLVAWNEQEADVAAREQDRRFRRAVRGGLEAEWLEGYRHEK